MKLLSTRAALAPILALALAAPTLAERTRVWRQTDYEQFRQGAADGVSLSSDGRVRLAAAIDELYDAPASYIWDLAVGPDGSVYAALGPEARVVRVRPGGDAETVFEADAVEAHALAVAPDGALLVATNPSGKLFRVTPGAASEELYDPGAAAIWDLAVSPAGDIFLATGDRGAIHRVRPDGSGTVYFETGETHVRALAFDADGRLLAGTDPGGMVLRIEESGGKVRGFVLYESSKAELTALAVSADGAVFAAGAGAKSAASSPAPPPAPAQPASSGAQPAAPPAAGPPAPLRGGSEIVRIDREGRPQLYWQSADEIVYALGFDGEGKLLAGTGGEGRLYRIEDERTYWLERTLASDQITALAAGPDGAVYAATSNVGKILALGPDKAASGELLSKALDTGGFARWGRLEFSGQAEGVELSLRTGNVQRPGSTWSPWSDAVAEPDGARVSLPGARYGQWRLRLSDPRAEVSAVRQYYRPANRAPEITHLELTPPNFRFPPRSRVVAPVVTLALPPLGSPSARRTTTSQPQTMTEAAGWVGLRWLASDPNDDELEATVSIRAEGTTDWIRLEAEPDADHFAFDATGFADGWSRLRVSVSDAEDNPPGEALSTERETEPFLIDNSEPAIEELSAVREGDRWRLRFRASDEASRIREAAVSINGGAWIPLEPAEGMFDSRRLAFDAALEGPDAASIAVRVRDERGNQTVARAR